MNDFVELTELAGEKVSAEQVERIARRYYWAAGYCAGSDVLEVACGSAQGVGYIARVAKSVTAGDYSEAILDLARQHYGDRFSFHQFDAQRLPFADASFDVVIMFEALYYLQEPERFFAEAARVLRPGAVLLMATANKDLYDFTPSPLSHRYFGVAEFSVSLPHYGLVPACFGDTPVGEVSTRERLLRPVKMAVTQLGLMPDSKGAKRFLKRFVFGGLVPMPPEITDATSAKREPTPLPAGVPDREHKVIFCAARKTP